MAVSLMPSSACGGFQMGLIFIPRQDRAAFARRYVIAGSTVVRVKSAGVSDERGQ